MPLVLLKKGSGEGGGGGGSFVSTFPNADILKKFSVTPDGKLVFNGELVVKDSETTDIPTPTANDIFDNAEILEKLSVNEKGELVYDGKVIGESSSGEQGQTFENADTLNKLSETEDGKLVFDGKVIGECDCNNAKTAEVTHYVTLNRNQKTIELPGDCDTSQAIVLSLNGVILDENVFWEIIEKNYPEPDLISWKGLELEKLAQEGDKILITYYRKC